MSCASVQSKSSASRKSLFEKLCQGKNNASLLETSCRSFLQDPGRNPLTGKTIQAKKDVHNFFSELCLKSTTKSNNSSPAISTAQVALEEMIEHKIESYLVTLDKFYTLRWGAGSAPKSTVSPIDWFVQVRHVESHVSREYDSWVAAGNEPVREFVNQHMEPTTLPHYSTLKAYTTELYEATQAFFNIHDLMTINDLDSIFKAVKDKHMVALAHFPSVHAERAHRQKLVKRVQDLEQKFKDIFHNDKDSKDVPWVRTELQGLTTQDDKRLHKFAERVYETILEAAVQRGFANEGDLDKAFYAGRRRLFH